MLPKYKYLLTYRYSEIVHDLTVEFCQLYISKFSRTYDQMVQAARSSKSSFNALPPVDFSFGYANKIS